MWHSTYKEKNARTFFAGARLLATVDFFAGVAALALPARTFLGAAGALGLAATAFFAGAVLGVLLVAEAVLVVFALTALIVVEAGFDLEVGLF
jgi:hypothetical protein